ncbi:MAG: hypothetical protein M1829_005026 [Trizodia sp. TS-e1964]|nr:MAG: hypothetical protein M1829_005026 [Trizodia sp. TS-e1964]
MGSCLSCLGLGHSRWPFDSSETARLLYDEAAALHYGLNGAAPGANQLDPQDIQRERQALEHIVAQTSDNLIDIFALQPQKANAPQLLLPDTFDTDGNSKTAQYQRLLQEASPVTPPAWPTPLAPGTITRKDRDWLVELGCNAEVVLERLKRVERGDVGKLLWGFDSLQVV